MVDVLPPAKELLADRGYDADWFRKALVERGIIPCIPSRKGRREDVPYDRVLYRQRHKIENMFAKLKDWRRIHTRYDRCAHTLLLGHLYRCYRHLLPQSMSPDPRSPEHFWTTTQTLLANKMLLSLHVAYKKMEEP